MRGHDEQTHHMFSYLSGASVIKCCYAATGMYMTAAAAILRE